MRLTRRVQSVLWDSRQLRKRMRRQLRRELVHAAGCTFNGRELCASRDVIDETIREALALGGVSIPRSLRQRARQIRYAQDVLGRVDRLLQSLDTLYPLNIPTTTPTPEL